MASNLPEVPPMTQDTTDNLEQTDASIVADDLQADPGRELLRTSLEDTGESSSLQEQEAATAQNNDAQKPSSSQAQQPSKLGIEGNPNVIKDLGHYMQDMNDYLTWKENLRITSVDLQIGGPYFDLWTKEANLFFRRLVILKKRMERIKKQQRA